MTPKTDAFETMTTEALWDLYEKVGDILKSRLTSRRDELDGRIAILNGAKPRNPSPPRRAVESQGRRAPSKRFYPPVKPKYRNPENRSETWAGRGKQPRWLTAALKKGAKLSDFAIRGRGRPSVKKRA